MSNTTIKAAIIGATGYTGMELLRLLYLHPDVSVETITSESSKGKNITEIHPQFRGLFNMQLESIEDLDQHELDVVFLGLPHKVSMDFVKKNHDKPFRIIDLSGDFRLDDKDVYVDWYGKEHVFPKGLDTAVYGLPELFGKAVKEAKLVGNPGCYPTASILPLAPLIKSNAIASKGIVVDAKSGVTGAGIKAKPNTHFPNVNDNFSVYGLKRHRHTPEIENALLRFSDHDTQVLFTPHLLPVDRGILTTSYSTPKMDLNDKELQEIYEQYYGDQPFVRVVDTPPQLKDVTGSNYCNIYATYDNRTNRVITIAVIDNLVKGAAGQAVQNMNLMFGLTETEGLQQLPMVP